MVASDKKQTSKDALLKAAEELFTVKSYVSVSTRELAERANVNLGAIQYHFGSKANLFVEATQTMLNGKWQECLVNLFGEEESLTQDEAAAKFCRFVFRFMNDVCNPQGPDTFRMIYREILSADPENEEMTEQLVLTIANEYYRHFDARLLKLLSKLLPELDSEELQLMADHVYAGCTSLPMDAPFCEVIRGHNPMEEPRFSKIRRHTAGFLLRGMGLTESQIESALSESEQYLEEN
jgi:AcrR family transcriptional regulator